MNSTHNLLLRTCLFSHFLKSLLIDHYLFPGLLGILLEFQLLCPDIGAIVVVEIPDFVLDGAFNIRILLLVDHVLVVYQIRVRQELSFPLPLK